MHELHAERQGHAQQLLRLAFRLDDDGGDDGLAGLDAAVLAGEANLLGAGFLALETELGPGRVDQLDLLFRRLGGGGSASRRGLRGRGRPEPWEQPSEPLLREGQLAPGAGAGCWACASEAIKFADSAEAANRAKSCPRGRIDPAKIRKFIAENPF